MPRESFQAELEALRAAVVELGETVLDRLGDALRALATGEQRLAREVMAGDDSINRRYLDLEGRCIDLFALQQPVATDLRLVAAAFKVLTDLERVGDLAANLAAYALGTDETIGVVDAADGPSLEPPVAFERIAEIGRDAEAMLRDALAAFEAGDGAACQAIADRDEEIDVLCQQAGEDVVRGLVATGADAGTEWDVERALDDVSRVLLAIRDIERVGDHAVNVAARTLYVTDHDPSLIVE